MISDGFSVSSFIVSLLANSSITKIVPEPIVRLKMVLNQIFSQGINHFLCSLKKRRGYESIWDSGEVMSLKNQY
jgi:hypothetical protein